jgi:hypothetical protein
MRAKFNGLPVFSLAERIGVWTLRPSPLGRAKKSLTLLCSDAGHVGRGGLGVAQWDACSLTLLFPLRRAAVSLDGWSAHACETLNGI